MPHDSDRLLAFTSRHRDRDGGLRKLAADMDQRVRQITARVPQISDRAWIDQMVAFLPGLHQI